MSWDVSIFRFAAKYRSVSEMPSDVQGLELGSRAAVHAAISEVFPEADFSNPTWGQFHGAFGSVEFNNGGEEPLMGFMMHVRAGPEIVAQIIDLCRRQGWSALDCSTGEMLEQSEDPEGSLKAWSTFRDKAIGDSSV
jgi:hypothetical protein